VSSANFKRPQQSWSIDYQFGRAPADLALDLAFEVRFIKDDGRAMWIGHGDEDARSEQPTNDGPERLILQQNAEDRSPERVLIGKW
jgi:hypothetical protein